MATGISDTQQFGSFFNSDNDGSAPTPPRRSLLCCSGKTVRQENILTSPVVKNIAGAMTVTGAGLIAGCPFLITALITTGLGTSWVGGAGIILVAVGVTLWLASAYLSAKDSENVCEVTGSLAKSTVMAAIGIPYVIAYIYFIACCGGRSADDSSDDWSDSAPDSGKHYGYAGSPNQNLNEDFWRNQGVQPGTQIASSTTTDQSKGEIFIT